MAEDGRAPPWRELSLFTTPLRIWRSGVDGSAEKYPFSDFPLRGLPRSEATTGSITLAMS